jgi:predicted dehydrogenase
VGAGVATARLHIPAINGVPEACESIIVDKDGERARRVAELYGFPRWSTNLEDVVRWSDFAIVTVPNGLHAEVSCQLLSQGIPVLCEKPMARTVEECRSMIESSRRGKVPLAIGHNRRFREHVRLARQLLQKGLIGDVQNVQAEEGSPNDWPRSPSFFDPVLSGGGTLMDVGIHSIDLIRWLVGEFEEVEYSGNGTPQCVESEGELRFRLSTGATGTIVASRTRDLKQKITFVGTGGFLEVGLWDPSLGIRCTKGKAFQNFRRLNAYVSRRPPQDASFVAQLHHFISALGGQEELLVTGEEGLAAVSAVCRAYSGKGALSPAFPSVKNLS